jgi:hypothetical protein
VGRLAHEHLQSLLRHLPKHDPRLLIGPQIGSTRAVIDAGDRYPFRLSSRGPTLLLVPPLRTVSESFQLTRLKFPGTPES